MVTHGARTQRQRRPAGDRGSTFIELLVAIVLLGTVVVGTLAGLRAAITGSEIDRDHSRAFVWLQSATDAIATTPYLSCATNAPGVILGAYRAAVAAVPRPDGWDPTSGATIDVTSVTYLSRSAGVDVWGSTCASGNAASPVYPQLVAIRVTDPDGELIRTLEVIKSA